MKKTAFFSDVFFSFFVCGIFTLCLFRHYGLSPVSSFLLAALCGVLCASAVGAILYGKRKHQLLKKSEAEQSRKLLLHLALLSDDKKTHFFENIFGANAPVKRWGKLRLTTPTEVYFLRFSFAPVNADDIAALARLKTSKEKILLCDSIDDKANALCASFRITVKSGAEVYLLVKAAHALPDVYLGDAKPEKRSERYRKLWFSKASARRFLLSGSLILLSSLFVPFTGYYLIVGAALLAFAAFARIFS